MSDDDGTTTGGSGAAVAVRKHRRGVRWTHWINGPLLLIMIWSGLRIYWADVRDPYGFGVGLVGWHWFDFLPDAVNERLGLERRLARGMAFHFTFGWLFLANGLAYGVYAWRTGHWRRVWPERRSWLDAVEVVRRDLFLGRRRELPESDRYNGAQRITYSAVIIMGAGAVLTGLAIYKPTQTSLLTTAFGGYEMARTIHFAITIAFLAFFALHLLQVARAGWGNFTAMITGYEKLPARSARRQEPASAVEPASASAVEPVSASAAGSVAESAPEPGSGTGSGSASAAEPSPAPLDGPVLDDEEYRRVSRRAVLAGSGSVVAAAVGWRALLGRPDDNNIPDVLRRGHEANEALWRRLSRQDATAPTFDRSRSSILRVNGRHGIESEIDLDAWRLSVFGPDGTQLGEHVLDDIMALPKIDYTVEHKCIEGWSHIVTWGGARFSDFAALYAETLGPDLTPFVAMATPDEEYYVSLDLASMLNPQTLLAYELEGEPLTLDHGAPLRLATPNKYGIKSIKRIGSISFATAQPTDYWYERGYDWYAQL